MRFDVQPRANAPYWPRRRLAAPPLIDGHVSARVAPRREHGHVGRGLGDASREDDSVIDRHATYPASRTMSPHGPSRDRVREPAGDGQSGARPGSGGHAASVASTLAWRLPWARDQSTARSGSQDGGRRALTSTCLSQAAPRARTARVSCSASSPPTSPRPSSASALTASDSGFLPLAEMAPAASSSPLTNRPQAD